MSGNLLLDTGRARQRDRIGAQQTFAPEVPRERPKRRELARRRRLGPSALVQLSEERPHGVMVEVGGPEGLALPSEMAGEEVDEVEDEDAVRSLGKNAFAFKMQSLILGGVIGGLAGIMFAISRQAVNADGFLPQVTFFIYVILILGGAASRLGPIVGAMIFWWQGRKKPAPGTRAHAIWVEGYESICAGLISGAALVGIGNAIVNVLIG